MDANTLGEAEQSATREVVQKHTKGFLSESDIIRIEQADQYSKIGLEDGDNQLNLIL